MDGNCLVTNNCVDDGSPEFEEYSNNTFCSIKALQNLTINVERYEVESSGEDDGSRIYYDYIEIHGIKYAEDGPQNVVMNAGDIFTWTTDESERYLGWKLCAPSTTTTATPITEEDDDDTGLIVGLSVGGVAILVVVGIIVKYSMKGGSGKAGYRLL